MKDYQEAQRGAHHMIKRVEVKIGYDPIPCYLKPPITCRVVDRVRFELTNPKGSGFTVRCVYQTSLSIHMALPHGLEP